MVHHLRRRRVHRWGCCGLVLAALFILLSTSAFYSRIKGSLPPGTTYGYTTIGSSNTSAASFRGMDITPTADIDITHGWLYGNDGVGGTETINIAIYVASTGVQVGTCSTTVGVLDVDGWTEVTFSPAVSLSSGTTYRIQYHCPTNGFIRYYYDDIGTNRFGYGASQCGTMYTSASTRRPSLVVADYDAY